MSPRRPSRQTACHLHVLRLLPSFTVVWLACTAVVLVQAQTSSPEQLGQVNFPITCRPEGQPELNRAGTPL